MDFPIKNGDFPWQNVSSPEGRYDPRSLMPRALFQHEYLSLSALVILNHCHIDVPLLDYDFGLSFSNHCP